MLTAPGSIFRAPLLAAALGGALALASPGAGAQAWNGFLQLPGIPGDSTDRDHPKWIPITAFSEGIDSPAPALGVGAGAGKATWRPLTVTHAVDMASPKIALAVANGRVLETATVELWKPGRTTNTLLLRLDLQSVNLTGLKLGGTSGAQPTEELQLSFTGYSANSVKVMVTTKGNSLAGRARAPMNPASAAWAATLAGRSALAASASDSAAWVSPNLLANPGAEAGPGAPEAWAADGGFIARSYPAPDAAHGQSYFGTTEADTAATGTQTVDVAAAAAAIDAGQLQAVLAGWLGGPNGAAEAARLVALFRDATGTELGQLRLASETGESTLVRLEKAGLVPAGTRAIEVQLQFERSSSSGGEAGMADDLSLVLQELAADSTDLPVDIQFLQASGSVEKSRVRLSWAPRSGGVVVESAANITGPWRTETGPVLTESGRSHFEVPASTGATARFWRVRPATELR